MVGNNALNVNDAIINGGSADIALTTRGSDWYWAVCAVMTAAAFAFMGLAYTKPRRDRIFHYITAGVVMVAAIAYFTMASHLGFTPIRVEFQRDNPIVRGVTREIYYVRYIDWVITTPLLLMDLLLTAALPWPTILWAILVDEVMIITGLVGALVASSYKWGYFVFGCVAMFWIIYILVWEGRRHANAISTDAGKAFLICGSLTAFMWTLYPIAWGLSEGGNVISSDGEAAFYGVLDLIAKPVFGALLIWGHRNISPADIGLAIHDYGADEPIFHEKNHQNGQGPLAEHSGANRPVNSATNGTNGTNGVTETV
ncbi:hypothetical protein CLAFUR4_14417 [Fulvia fulva]|nr:hypothetical protein CLAFUR4_14417 [Fulvia fulva]WPV37675.1 hypothetical protein CLAFUW7_14426 [Fulvia fulva]